jgi:hypothetical protein
VFRVTPAARVRLMSGSALAIKFPLLSRAYIGGYRKTTPICSGESGVLFRFCVSPSAKLEIGHAHPEWTVSRCVRQLLWSCEVKPNSKAGKKAERADKVKYRPDTEFAILPGEDPREFESLFGQLASEHAPDGPVEQDLVLTLAKCFWRKRRYQRFLEAKVTAAKFDPSREGYDGPLALVAFDFLIDEGDLVEEQIRLCVASLGGRFAAHLKEKCPEGKFGTVEEWVTAMQAEVRTVLLPASKRCGPPPDEVLIKRASAVLTDDALARELEFEDRIDRKLEQTLDRLAKVKAAKQPASFREAQRRSRSPPRRIIGLAG